METPSVVMNEVQGELFLLKMLLSNLKAAELFISAGVEMADALVDLYPAADTVVTEKMRPKTIEFFRSFDRSMNALSKDFPKDLIKQVESRVTILEKTTTEGLIDQSSNVGTVQGSGTNIHDPDHTAEL